LNAKLHLSILESVNKDFRLKLDTCKLWYQWSETASLCSCKL